MEENILNEYFCLPGLFSTYWLNDWSCVFLTVESLLKTTGLLKRSAAFCNRSACSSVSFCQKKQSKNKTEHHILLFINANRIIGKVYFRRRVLWRENPTTQMLVSDNYFTMSQKCMEPPQKRFWQNKLLWLLIWQQHFSCGCLLRSVSNIHCDLRQSWTQKITICQLDTQSTMYILGFLEQYVYF